MNIDNCTDAIKNCRFCFMCRHLSAIGNVTFTEADTPRVRAAMTYGVTMYPEQGLYRYPVPFRSQRLLPLPLRQPL